MIAIAPYENGHWPAVWSMLEPVFRAGDSYAIPVDVTEQEARVYWVEAASATFVASDAERDVIGSYFIRPNQRGPGSHVCNCGYVVAPAARGQGVARGMCEHSQDIARRMGFRAMQFNLVVSTNQTAVRLWERLGFAVAGTLPGAFRHPAQGFVDAHVMFKTL
jgi:ribosomal protein S18 acetylase RimI-like enzyme